MVSALKVHVVPSLLTSFTVQAAKSSAVLNEVSKIGAFSSAVAVVASSEAASKVYNLFMGCFGNVQIGYLYGNGRRHILLW